MSDPFAARAEVQRDGSLKIKFRFRREVVEALKDRIPGSDRIWDPDEKVWIVAPTWSHVALEILKWYFDVVDLVDRVVQAPTQKIDADFSALHLLPSAPPELVRAAYKTMAKISHPDRGGSTRVMQTLNASFEALQRRGAA